MSNWKNNLFLVTVICILGTVIGVYLLGGIDRQQLQAWLKESGIWAPIIYIALYTLGTLLILPSTPLNLTGGAIFGSFFGTLWTSLAAIVAAVISFAYARTIGRELIAQRFAGRWEALDAEIKYSGLFYMFAIRLLPIIPYGLVNFAAGLTSIRFNDYLFGTILGTVPGVLPFVMLGSYGLQAIETGDFLPLIFALGLTGMLVGSATWYRHRRRDSQKDLAKKERY